MPETAKFDEVLKEARIYHYALVLACAALLATIPRYTDLPDVYRLAGDDLKLTQGLLQREWEESHSEERDLFPPLNRPSILAGIKTLNTRISDNLSENFSQKLEAKLVQNGSGLAKISFRVPFQISRLGYTATMGDVRQFFAAPKILTLVPDMSLLGAKIDAALPDACNAKPCKIALTIAGGVPEPSKLAGQENRTINCIFEWDPNHSSSAHFDIPTTVTLIQGPDLGKEFNEQLPYLRRVYDQIALLTPEQALLFLETKRIAAMESITFLGLALPQSIRFVLMLLITSLLALLRAHIFQIERMSNGGTTPEWGETRTTFPWFPLYPDWASRLATQVTVVWLPIVSIALLSAVEILKLGVSEPRLTFFLYFVFACVCISLASGIDNRLKVLKISSIQSPSKMNDSKLDVEF